MFKVLQFPSVIEGNNAELRQVAPDLLHGLKLFEKRRAYVIGDLALSEGVAPHKNINSAPTETEYALLLKSGLLLANQQLNKAKLTVSSGFPSSTYPLYREQAVANIQREHIIEFDAATYSTGLRRNIPLQVEQAQIIPEIQGCILGLRKGEQAAKGSFFVVSLGFGTCEAILSTEAGTVQRTAVSVNGLRYAVNLLMQEVGRQYYLELKNEHQIDIAFQKGFLFASRKRVDLKEARARALSQYYQEVISPALRRAFVDSDFQRADTLYLVGGGANYDDLVEQFKNEFKDVLNIVIPTEPAAIASKGYCLHSYEVNADKSAAVGIDIGNATTIVTLFADAVQGPAASAGQEKQESPQAVETPKLVVNGKAEIKAAEKIIAQAPPVLIEDEPELAQPAAIVTKNVERTAAPKAEKPATRRIQKFLITGTW